MKIVGAVSSDFSPSVAIKDPEIPKTATLMVNICEQYIMMGYVRGTWVLWAH